MSFYDVNRFERRIVNLLAEASSSQFYLQHMEPVLCVHRNKIYSSKQQKITLHDIFFKIYSNLRYIGTLLYFDNVNIRVIILLRYVL
jgi:hypothetical protein